MRFSLPRAFALPAFLLAVIITVSSRAEVDVRRDIEYAKAGDVSLKLDLYIPAGEVRPPLIAWVHGGGWGSGSKDDMPLKGLLARGFAVASIEYRLSRVAPFPAQAHDIKAAIRFLRAKAGGYGVVAQFLADAIRQPRQPAPSP